MLQCKADTPTHPLPKGHNKRVEPARRLFEEHLNKILQSLKHPEITPEQNYIINKFNELRDDLLTSENQRNLINHLISVISQPLPSYVLTELRALKRNKIAGSELVDKIDKLVYHFELEQRLTNKPDISNFPIAKIYCSESLWKPNSKI
ncbi:MAG: hypothetical protein ABFS56_09630 [Pseudomonadota bacterium]